MGGNDMNKIIHLIDSNLQKSNDRLSFVMFALSGRKEDKLEFSAEEVRGCLDILSQVSKDLRWFRRIMVQTHARRDRAKTSDKSGIEAVIEVEAEIDRAMGISEEFLYRENEEPSAGD